MPLAQFATDLSTTVAAQFGPSATSITVSSASGFPSASSTATPPTIFHLADPAVPNDLITVTSTSGTTWQITQGSEGTVAQVHAAGCTLYLVASGNDLSGMLQSVNNLSDVASASAALGHLGAPLASPTFTGTVTLPSAAPTAATQAAPKSYVDSVAQGLSGKYSAVAATTGSETYTIASGSVTQITGTTVDGQSPAVNDYLLIKDAPAATGTGSAGSAEPGNGLYQVTSNTTNLSVSRAADMSGSNAPAGSYIFVDGGTANGSSGWVVSAPSTNAAFTYGTNNIKFTQFSGAGEITAGTGLTKSGNTLSLSTPVTGSNVAAATTSTEGVIQLAGALGGSGTTAASPVLSATGVTAASYTNTNLTVQADGRITAASSGSAGGGDTSGSATWSTATPTLNPSAGDIQAITITSTSIITAITIDAPGTAIFTLTLYISGASTVGGIQNSPSAWPASVTWLSGEPPVFVPGDGVTSGVPPLVVVLQTTNTGTNWYGTATDLPLPLPAPLGGTGQSEGGQPGTVLMGNGTTSTPSWQGILGLPSTWQSFVPTPAWTCVTTTGSGSTDSNITISDIPAANSMAVGYPVFFTGPIPSTLKALWTYYVVYSSWTIGTGGADPGQDVFQIGTTPASSAISIASAASGFSVAYVLQPGSLQPFDISAASAITALPQAPDSNALCAVKIVNTPSTSPNTTTTLTVYSLGNDVIGRNEGFVSPSNSTAAVTSSVLSLQGQGQVFVYIPGSILYQLVVNNTNTAAFSVGSSGQYQTQPGPFANGTVVFLSGTAPTGTNAPTLGTNYYVVNSTWSGGSSGIWTFGLAATAGGTALPAVIPATVYIQSAGVWTVIADDLPLAQLDARYVLETALPLAITSGGTGAGSASAAFTAITAPGGTMTGPLSPNVGTLSFTGSGGTTSVTLADGNSFNLTLGASATVIGSPGAGTDGEVIKFRITNITSGSYTFVTGSSNDYHFGTAGFTTPYTNATGLVDIWAFEYVSSISRWCWLGSGLGF